MAIGLPKSGDPLLGFCVMSASRLWLNIFLYKCENGGGIESPHIHIRASNEEIAYFFIHFVMQKITPKKNVWDAALEDVLDGALRISIGEGRIRGNEKG
jgi:hypothetical protein